MNEFNPNFGECFDVLWLRLCGCKCIYWNTQRWQNSTILVCSLARGDFQSKRFCLCSLRHTLKITVTLYARSISIAMMQLTRWPKILLNVLWSVAIIGWMRSTKTTINVYRRRCNKTILFAHILSFICFQWFSPETFNDLVHVSESLTHRIECAYGQRWYGMFMYVTT